MDSCPYYGNIGNERADVLAKESASKQYIDVQVSLDKSFIRNNIKYKFVSTMCQNWETTKNDRIAWNCIKSPNLNITYSNFYLKCIRT